MKYTYKEAIKTAYKYLSIDDTSATKIENTSGRGIVCEFGGSKKVVFIYPISCKQNNKQNFFDTRDSGVKERRITWEYARENKLPYFCLGFNEEQERYKGYVLSLESDESDISNVSYRKDEDSGATGTQVNIPNDFIPSKKFERTLTSKGLYIAAIKKECISDYLTLFDNRPYLKSKEEKEKHEGFTDFSSIKVKMLSLDNQKFAFACIDLMKKHKLLTSDNLKLLSNKDNCATMFKHNNYNGILFKLDSDNDENEQKKEQDGHLPYYSNYCYIDGVKYAVSSEWKSDKGPDENRTLFVNWIIEQLQKVKFKTGYKNSFPRNRILFGAPGTGKSFELNKQRINLLGEDNKLDYERVTFHPDYSYANFVGTYKPVMVSTKHEVALEEDKKEILAVLQDENKTAQEKYDLLYEKFKDDGLTRLPILLGLYTDESFKTKKQDGTDAVGDNSVERNHGRAIRPYIDLLSTTTTEKEIVYQYVPGPFMRILVKALKSAMTESPKPYLLLIEEINRANVAAVFGDVFQLLDRAANGVSEYEIATTNDMRAYLAQELDVDESDVETIKIPDNMFIWATMNSADQGVFPMDTAFKRRWDFSYLGIDDAVGEMSDTIKKKKYTLGTGANARLVKWNDLRSAINDVLSSESYNINEDKLLGPYFISKSILESEDEKEFIKVFKNKVLMYLFDDAAKQKKKTFFEKCKDEVKGVRYSDLCNQFDTKGVFIFPEEISKRFTEKPTTEEVTEANKE